MESNFKTERKTIRQGFTLIELLVVVLIMGILASVAMPQYFKSVEKSRAAEAIDALSAIASAQERLYMKTGTYAGSSSSSPLHELDIGISNLSYFTIKYINASSGASYGDARALQTQRNTSAGGGLGSYIINLRIPAIPGTGSRTWECSPVSAGCKSFLPQ